MVVNALHRKLVDWDPTVKWKRACNAWSRVVLIAACSTSVACGLLVSLDDLSSSDAATTDAAPEASSDAANPIDAGAITFRIASSNNGANAAVTVPAPPGIVQNDFLWILLAIDDDTVTTANVPSNWQLTSQLADTNFGFRTIAYTAFAQANEPTSYSLTLSKPIDWAIEISAYAGVRQQTPFNVAPSFMMAASSPFVAPAITTTVANAVVLFGFANESGDAGWAAPSTISTRNQDVFLLQADLTQPTAGATSSQSVTYGNSEGMIVVAALAPQ